MSTVIPTPQTDSTATPSARTAAPVVAGPLWYRTRIRLFGPLLALIVPGIVGAIAYAALEFSDAEWSGAVGLIGGVLAAPTLLAVGAPFSNRDLYPLAIGAALVMWVLIGVLASRRATRNPMATWRDFWRHYFWMLGGVWVGAIAALIVAGRTIGESLW